MKKYLSLVVFSHTIFAMPFAVIGFVLGWMTSRAEFSWILFLKMIFCMITARTAAMAFNRIVDAKFDAINPRTSAREIPAGRVSIFAATVVVVVSSLMFILTCYSINKTVFLLSPIALLVVLGYSFTKRFTAGAHLFLGVGLALAPLGAYLVINPVFDLLPILFSGVVIFWVAGFDIIYSLQDVDFDRKNNLYSVPALLGVNAALRVSEVFHVFGALLLIVAGLYGQFGLWYWIGCAMFILLLIYQHSLVKATDLSRINRAFFTSNGIASMLFAGFVVTDVLLN